MIVELKGFEKRTLKDDEEQLERLGGGLGWIVVASEGYWQLYSKVLRVG